MTTYLDTETRCGVNIKVGTDRYTASAECLIVTWAKDDEPVNLWDLTKDFDVPPALEAILLDESEPIIAQNAAFDKRIFMKSLRRSISINRWRCNQAQAYAHGLPGSLEAQGIVLELGEDDAKMAEDGHRLMLLFCIPHNEKGEYYTRHDYPAEWELFCEYAKRDVHSMRIISRKMPSHNFIGEHLAMWQLDQLINERGFGFDTTLAVAAVKLLATAKAKHDAKVLEMTDGAVRAATQRKRLLDYFVSQGLDIPNMKAATIREWLESDDLRPEIRALLELRLEASKSSGAKYKRGLEMMGSDGRIRYAFQFSGAGRTGRFSGRGFQPQNLTRPSPGIKAKFVNDTIIPDIISGAALDRSYLYGGPNIACADALRGAIIAAPGNELVACDWSNIESRVLAWIAGAEAELRLFAAADRGESADAYRVLYAQFFGGRPEDVTDNERQAGKVVKLACGFGGSVGAFVSMAAIYQIDLDTLPALVLHRVAPEILKKAKRAWRRAFMSGEDYALEPDVFTACHCLVQLFRESNSEVNQVRHDIDAATKNALKSPGTMYEVARCKIWATGTWLIIQLPSGRRLLYGKPKLVRESEVDPESGKESVYESITYMAARGRQTYRREKAWAGLFLENIVQAIANCVLRAALLLIHEDTQKVPAIAAYLAKLPPLARTAISMHVHDEPVIDVPVGTYPVSRLVAMCTTELLKFRPWMRGLPMAASGWADPRYHKG